MRLICMSHSPLMRKLEPRDHLGHEFFQIAEELKQQLHSNPPDVIVVFGPDHFNGFRWNMMPPFCIGTAATSMSDWDIHVEKLDVPEDLALNLIKDLRGRDFDVAMSREMQVDHGITIPLELLMDGFASIPVIPVFINCVAPPLPSARRCRMIGKAVGKFFGERDLDVLFIGSGGISHDPPHPAFSDLPDSVKDIMLGRAPWGQDQERARQQRIISAANALADGEEPCLPPNADWDKGVLAILQRQMLTDADALNDDWITANGGRGGQEIKAWLAAFAALEAAAGTYSADLLYHEVVPEWMTGMAIMTAGPQHRAEG